MGDYHLFRGVLPQQAILIAPDGRAFVIDKESLKNTVEPETWTVSYDLEGRSITGQDVQALCEAYERLYTENAQARILLEEALAEMKEWLWVNRERREQTMQAMKDFLAQQRGQGDGKQI